MKPVTSSNNTFLLQERVAERRLFDRQAIEVASPYKAEPLQRYDFNYIRDPAKNEAANEVDISKWPLEYWAEYVAEVGVTLIARDGSSDIHPVE